LTLRIKTSNALLIAVVAGSGLRIVELADRRVVRQLNTIHSHVRTGFDRSDMVQFRAGRRNALEKALPCGQATSVISAAVQGGASHQALFAFAWRRYQPHVYMYI
jgi:hypothetical protein